MSTAHRAWTIGGGLLAVAIAAATACSAGAHSSAPVVAAASSAAASPTVASSTPTRPASPASSAPAVAAATSAVAPPTMPAAQLAAATADLAGLAARLPSGVRLTAPAAWASWTGARPTYADDIDGCPRLADRLGAALGGRWSYWQGTLPSGPYGCSWTTVPLSYDARPPGKVIVSIGYQRGALPDLLTGTDSCAGGVEAPRLAVPAVHPGALLVTCAGTGDGGFDLFVPDTGGSGVFSLHSTGGTAVTNAKASAALLAILSAAHHVYG